MTQAPTDGELVRDVLRLESTRVLAMAVLIARGGGDLAEVQAVDQALERSLEGLAGRGIAYPGHVLGSRYALESQDYLLLQVALMPYHAPEDLEVLCRVQGGDFAGPRLSQVLALIAPSTEHPALRAEIAQRPLVREGLVRLDGQKDPEDPNLEVHRAVLELYGLWAKTSVA